MRQVEGIYFVIIGSAFPARLVYVILAHASIQSNNKHQYSILELVPPFIGVYLFFVRTKEKVRKESRP